MSIPDPNLLVSVADSVAFFKINGRANFASSIQFKSAFTELERRGLHRFVLDLSDCLLMDSTFLGVLAGISVRVSKNPSSDNGRNCLALVNPNDRVSGLLDNLGVLEHFAIVQASEPKQVRFEPASACAEPTKEELSKNCLEAHQILMALNPANVAKFKEVTRFLEEDLKKNSGDPAPAPI